MKKQWHDTLNVLLDANNGVIVSSKLQIEKEYKWKGENYSNLEGKRESY